MTIKGIEINIGKPCSEKAWGYHIPMCHCMNAENRGIKKWQILGIILYAFGYAMFIIWQPRKCREFCETIF